MVRKRASAKASSAASPSDKRRKMTAEQRAQQKLRENFSSMTEEERECVVSSESGLTLRATLERDVRRGDEGAEVAFGKWYFESLRTEFRTESSVFHLLAPPKDCKEEVAPKLLEASCVPWAHLSGHSSLKKSTLDVKRQAASLAASTSSRATKHVFSRAQHSELVLGGRDAWRH